jgi:transketolase
MSMPSIKPFDAYAVDALVDEGRPVLTYEDHSVLGGLGSAVAEVIAETGRGVPFRRVGLQDRYPYVVGDAPFLRKHLGVPSSDELFNWIADR